MLNFWKVIESIGRMNNNSKWPNLFLGYMEQVRISNEKAFSDILILEYIMIT